MRCYARATIHDSSQRGVCERCANGRTLTQVFKAENQGVPFVMSRVAAGSIIHADEASHWDTLHTTRGAANSAPTLHF